MKKIKTFNADEEVYNELQLMLKTYEVKTGISSFLNTCLSELLEHIKYVEQLKKKNPNSELPMSFVIEKMAKSLSNKITIGPVFVEEGSDSQEIIDSEILTAWENIYEAKKLGISVEMYSYLEDGRYVLAPSKQYLIEEKTGKKYIAFPNHNRIGDSILLVINETNE